MASSMVGDRRRHHQRMDDPPGTLAKRLDGYSVASKPVLVEQQQEEEEEEEKSDRNKKEKKNTADGDCCCLSEQVRTYASVDNRVDSGPDPIITSGTAQSPAGCTACRRPAKNCHQSLAVNPGPNAAVRDNPEAQATCWCSPEQPCNACECEDFAKKFCDMGTHRAECTVADEQSSCNGESDSAVGENHNTGDTLVGVLKHRRPRTSVVFPHRTSLSNSSRKGSNDLEPWPIVEAKKSFLVEEAVFATTAGPGGESPREDPPEISFNDEHFWPVAIALDERPSFRKRITVYVAYSQHISEFTGDGKFVRKLIYLEQGYYNDIALASHNKVLVASISGWAEKSGEVFRYQRVRIYKALTGRLLLQMETDSPEFHMEVPVISLCAKDDDHVLAMDRTSICEVNILSGALETRLQIESPGVPSHVCYRNDKYYITDAANGCVKVYNKFGQLQTALVVDIADGQKSIGLRGLAVDQNGLILVSDFLGGLIRIYTADGVQLKTIGSDGRVRWPLGMGVTLAGHVFVVDHGNACIRKYKYL